jgi:hypothetical protein
MSTARLLGIPLLFALVFSSSESVPDDGISPPLPAATVFFPVCYSVTFFTSSWEVALIDCCCVFLRCVVQCLRFSRSREPSSRTRSPGYRTGTSRTRTAANGSAWGARRSTAAWLLCKDLLLPSHVPFDRTFGARRSLWISALLCVFFCGAYL